MFVHIIWQGGQATLVPSGGSFTFRHSSRKTNTTSDPSCVDAVDAQRGKRKNEPFAEVETRMRGMRSFEAILIPGRLRKIALGKEYSRKRGKL